MKTGVAGRLAGARLWSWAVLLPLCGLAACAELPPQPVVSQDEVAWAGAGAGRLDAAQPLVLENLGSLMQVTPEMSRFARDVTAGHGGAADKLDALTAALGSAKGLDMQYDAQATLTAQQAFAQRRANCLSYTMLFVALAREVGIPAKFNEVDIPPIWDMGDEHTSLLYKHINARVDLDLMFYRMVDVSGDEYDPAYGQEVISDAEAAAQFYNNRAVEMRLQGRLADSLRYEVRALQLAPGGAYLWDNLASLYLLLGEGKAARVAVTQALQLDGSSLLGYDTAAQVYDKLGEPALARYFRGRAAYFLAQNPYHHYQLALKALQAHDKQLAYDEAGQAILLYPKDARFFFLMAIVLDQMGDSKRAGESLHVALLLAPDAERQERYKSKFARLTKQEG